MDRSDKIRIGQEGLLLGAGTVPRPAGLLGPGAPLDPYPMYGHGAGVGVGSASEAAAAGGKCCGASLGAASAPARSSQAAPLLTGSAFEDAAPSRGDRFADPSAPAAPVLEAARASAPSGPTFLQTARPSPFALPPGRDCEDAPCEGVVHPRDWMVQYVRTGATWHVLPARSG